MKAIPFRKVQVFRMAGGSLIVEISSSESLSPKAEVKYRVYERVGAKSAERLNELIFRSRPKTDWVSFGPNYTSVHIDFSVRGQG